jgi:hypothetical protein
MMNRPFTVPQPGSDWSLQGCVIHRKQQVTALQSPALKAGASLAD